MEWCPTEPFHLHIYGEIRIGGTMEHFGNISDRKAMQFSFAKQHVLPGKQSDDLLEVANNLVGLHAARLSTPYVSLFLRISDFKSSMLWENLYESKRLIKIRCMRRTLHILPLHLAPIAHHATLSMRIAECRQRYRSLNVEPAYVLKLKHMILELVTQEPREARMIQNQFPEAEKHLISTVIKELWETGQLCYLNLKTHWSKEQRFYGRTDLLYPTLDWRNSQADSAITELIFYHIAKYGPVTEKDIAWWSGLSNGTIRKAIRELSASIVSLTVGDQASVSYMVASDFTRLQQMDFLDEPWVKLLAYEDPSLKGYYESRNRYVEPIHYDLLFNRIGEARASILINGKVAGLWSFDKKKQQIQWEIFDSCEYEIKQKILQKVREMEDYLSD